MREEEGNTLTTEISGSVGGFRVLVGHAPVLCEGKSIHVWVIIVDPNSLGPRVKLRSVNYKRIPVKRGRV